VEKWVFLLYVIGKITCIIKYGVVWFGKAICFVICYRKNQMCYKNGIVWWKSDVWWYSG